MAAGQGADISSPMPTEGSQNANTMFENPPTAQYKASISDNILVKKANKF